jgi:hypothetical protein
MAHRSSMDIILIALAAWLAVVYIRIESKA